MRPSGLSLVQRHFTQPAGLDLLMQKRFEKKWVVRRTFPISSANGKILVSCSRRIVCEKNTGQRNVMVKARGHALQECREECRVFVSQEIAKKCKSAQAIRLAIGNGPIDDGTSLQKELCNKRTEESNLLLTEKRISD